MATTISRQSSLLSQLKEMPLNEGINIADILNQYGSGVLMAITEFNDGHIKPTVFHDKIDPRKLGNQASYSGALSGGNGNVRC